MLTWDLEKPQKDNFFGTLFGAIIEKRSLRRNHWKENHREEIIEERGIWEASGRHLGRQEAMGLQEAPKHKKTVPLSARMQRTNKKVVFT